MMLQPKTNADSFSRICVNINKPYEYANWYNYYTDYVPGGYVWDAEGSEEVA